MNDSAWTVIGGVVVAIGGFLVGAYLKVSGILHSQGKESREQTNKELREVVDELRELLEQSRKECHDVRDVLTTKSLESTLCQVNLSRATERIEWLEDLLTRHGIAFKRWQGDSSASIDAEKG